jgi:hypothetical protein
MPKQGSSGINRANIPATEGKNPDWGWKRSTHIPGVPGILSGVLEGGREKAPLSSIPS